MRLYTLIFTVFLSSSAILAEPSLRVEPPKNDPFEELDQEIKSLRHDRNSDNATEFKQWKDKYLTDYQEFRNDHFKVTDHLRDDLISTWGNAEVSSKTKLVEYSLNKKIKTVLDFEENTARISFIHNGNTPINQSDVTNSLGLQYKKNDALSLFVGKNVDGTLIKKSVAKVNNNFKNILVQETKLIQQQGQAQKKQIEKIIDQLDYNNNKYTTLKNASSKIKNTEISITEQQNQIEKETQQRISNLQKNTTSLENNNTKRAKLESKKITTFTILLKSKNHLSKAKPFLNKVKSQSKRWGLPPSLMLAIIHTESYFNPKAQSHVPAYGLMQIVPLTAGVDVNIMLNNKNSPMKRDDLFLPDYNITAGVAYMHILNSRYLKKIVNSKSRLYCMVAAYNTGSGNVAKAFNIDRSRDVNKAATIINKLTPKEVYLHLINNLPYDETRHYVKKVIERQKIYSPIVRF